MVANVAVIQGSSKGIGLSFARYILRKTDLKLVATSQNPKQAHQAILSNLGKSVEDRLTTLELDVRREETIEKVADVVKDRFGRQLRLLINVSGVLLPEKSIQKVDLEDMKRTFEINTFGHLLTYKHFVPLIPPKSSQSQVDEIEDPAKGLVKENVHVLASLSARVGSIGDNSLGGWYSYRASKTALNQIIVTLQQELSNAGSRAPAITVALHPGTVAGTNLSKDFVPKDKAGTKEGVHDADQAVERLCGVISRLGQDDGGQFLDYKGDTIVW
ncbi:hypothetical protein CROQUDRAFT_719309 [Cronartium quercuum f. sp. fusiforme G11]|uniref:Rossman fold oxidoreductase n=1 Tax=Cronartium quercuum f. sp. fusiforme G11 TaxID=708437 RepID=A0A9P6THI4_9BASI|nr:hypothetical protein CROQUDRAFT_719309 [Cronartium quercuum f. sp. fusiforme G11]